MPTKTGPRKNLMLLLLPLLCTSSAVGAQATPDLDTEQIAKQVGQVRGLPPTGPIKTGVKSREELQAVVEQKLREEYSAKRLASE